MFQKKALGVFVFLAAVSALAWMGGSVPAKAKPGDQALGPGQPLTRHTAVLKGSGEELSFPVLTLAHEIISPRDAASGLPTGKRQHKPFSITKQVDKSSPALFKACIEGEPLNVEITTFLRRGGRYVPIVTTRLDNAFIATIGPQSADDRPTEEVAFYYNKISFSYAETGTTVEDFWSGEYP
jgi:type VI secretion system secreted protein Hcp